MTHEERRFAEVLNHGKCLAVLRELLRNGELPVGYIGRVQELSNEDAENTARAFAETRFA